MPKLLVLGSKYRLTGLPVCHSQGLLTKLLTCGQVLVSLMSLVEGNRQAETSTAIGRHHQCLCSPLPATAATLVNYQRTAYFPSQCNVLSTNKLRNYEIYPADLSDRSQAPDTLNSASGFLFVSVCVLVRA